MENLEEYKIAGKSVHFKIDEGSDLLSSLCISYSGDRQTLSENFSKLGKIIYCVFLPVQDPSGDIAPEMEYGVEKDIKGH